MSWETHFHGQNIDAPLCSDGLFLKRSAAADFLLSGGARQRGMGGDGGWGGLVEAAWLSEGPVGRLSL